MFCEGWHDTFGRDLFLVDFVGHSMLRRPGMWKRKAPWSSHVILGKMPSNTADKPPPLLKYSVLSTLGMSRTSLAMDELHVQLFRGPFDSTFDIPSSALEVISIIQLELIMYLLVSSPALGIRV